MSNNIDALINEYESANADRRSTIIELVSENASNARVVSLLLEVLLNRSEEDFVRVEVLKCLPAQETSVTVRKQYGDAVFCILNDKDDSELVRQYAALAMRGFVNLEGALALLEKIVCDSQEEVNVRHNAISSIERNSSHPDCLASLERLVHVPGLLGKSARETLLRVSSK